MYFLDEFKKITYNCYLRGWNEMNGGNLSYRLTEEDIKNFPDKLYAGEWIPIQGKLDHIKNKYFYVTNSGKYFQNVKDNLADTCSLIQINSLGTMYRKCFGVEDVSLTSELPTHLLAHNLLCANNGDYRIVLHGHQPNLIALSAIISSDIDLTKQLWSTMTECLVIFPNGIKYIDWKVPGNYEIARLSADVINDYDLIIWKNHGTFVKGKSFDQVFGIIDTVEKAAMILLMLTPYKEKSLIKDSQLRDLAAEFNVLVNERYDI